MSYDTRAVLPTAILVSVQLPRQPEGEARESLAELNRLVTTLGYRVLTSVTQHRSTLKSPTVVGEGKLRELAKWTNGTGVIAPLFERKKTKAEITAELGKADEKTAADHTADQEDGQQDDQAADQTADQEDADAETAGKSSEDSSDEIEGLAIPAPTEVAQCVVFDCDLSPSQFRNIEGATGARVLDRTAVIIEIFNRHAQSRLAKLQIEIARLHYQAPRARETAGTADRGGGGVGGRGAGESKLELDKRKIRDRIKELKTEIAQIQNEQEHRRARRTSAPGSTGAPNTIALVGYTNAGKSSMMRALTGSQVLVEDKLFATLDTTVRPMVPETHPRILVSDTVGFIRNLPHDLVASFKTTLDEALHASLVLIIVDCSDPSFRSQLKVTQTVLAEVGADQIPHTLILNKIDKLDAEALNGLSEEFPNAVQASAQNTSDVSRIHQHVVAYFEKDMIEQTLELTYAQQNVIGEIRSLMRVVKENYTNDGMSLTVRARPEDLNRILKRLDTKP